MENTSKCLIPRSEIGEEQAATSHAEPTNENFHFESKSDNKKTSKMKVNRLFEKKFHYQKPKENIWKLPPPSQAFSEYYQIDTLQQLKPKLNDVKCKLNNYTIEDWSLHTRRHDPANEIPWRLKNETNAEFVTIAWCKFFECLHSYPLVKGSHLNSLHLCELPGAFIAALNHYMYSTYEREEVKWRWLSTTLNPYYEGNPTSSMISDDRFMFHTFDNWLMHDDFTGNIINRKHIEQMQEHCKQRLEDNVQLITADGSIDCVDAPDCQEEVVATLHFAEIVAALSILADGGCFVVKMFTMFESTNVCKLFLLNCVFEEVHVFKPATSKRGNSEVYVICIGYRKQTKNLPEILQLMKENVECTNIFPLFPKSFLPNDFLLQHEICARLFMNFQIEAIKSNIQSYKLKLTPRQVAYKQHLRNEATKEFYSRYKVCCIADQDKILGEHQTGKETCKSAPFCRGSYAEREMAKETTMEQRIFSLHRTINQIEKKLDLNCDIQFQEEYDTSNISTPELHIYRGAPFTELNSSLFANPFVMQLHQNLKELLNRDPIYMMRPKCIADEVEIELNNTHGFSLLPREFFIQLLDTIYEKPSREIVLSNVLFLTHLSVSVLHSLALYIFGHLSISNEPDFQIKLLAKSNNYTQFQMSTLKIIRDLLAEDANVLCIRPIEKLHRNNFADTLMAYNNQLLMKNFKLVLNN